MLRAESLTQKPRRNIDTEAQEEHSTQIIVFSNSVVSQTSPNVLRSASERRPHEPHVASALSHLITDSGKISFVFCSDTIPSKRLFIPSDNSVTGY
jgi:hypothetical protein